MNVNGLFNPIHSRRPLVSWLLAFPRRQLATVRGLDAARSSMRTSCEGNDPDSW